LTPEEEGAEEGDEQPKRRSVDQVPLGIRKTRQFDSSQFVDEQKAKDEQDERELLDKVDKEDLESPDIHQDYEIQDGEEFDRHLEGISSVNALKELIIQAKEQVEDELEVTNPKPFSEERTDRLMVFTKEAITGYGEDQGYEELKKRVRELIEEDLRFAQAEMDRKKEAYLRSSGK
jgi:hypothetical protein